MKKLKEPKPKPPSREELKKKSILTIGKKIKSYFPNGLEGKEKKFSTCYTKAILWRNVIKRLLREANKYSELTFTALNIDSSRSV